MEENSNSAPTGSERKKGSKKVPKKKNIDQTKSSATPHPRPADLNGPLRSPMFHKFFEDLWFYPRLLMHGAECTRVLVSLWLFSQTWEQKETLWWRMSIRNWTKYCREKHELEFQVTMLF